MCRNSQGEWIIGSVQNLGITSPITTKFWVDYQGHKLAWDNGYLHVILEVDSQEVVDILMKRKPTNVYNRVLLEQCADLINKDWIIEIKYIYIEKRTKLQID